MFHSQVKMQNRKEDRGVRGKLVENGLSPFIAEKKIKASSKVYCIEILKVPFAASFRNINQILCCVKLIIWQNRLFVIQSRSHCNLQKIPTDVFNLTLKSVSFQTGESSSYVLFSDLEKLFFLLRRTEVLFTGSQSNTILRGQPSLY